MIPRIADGFTTPHPVLKLLTAIEENPRAFKVTPFRTLQSFPTPARAMPDCTMGTPVLSIEAMDYRGQGAHTDQGQRHRAIHQ
jgi:hypothetical protein